MIKAPPDIQQQYVDILIMNHDFCSKSKFDIGLTNVIEHKVVPDRYTIRVIRDCVNEIGLAGSKIFSTIDLTSGFWQQSLEERSCQYTAFTVLAKVTRYQWTLTPLGLQGSPASFARLIGYVMRGLSGFVGTDIAASSEI